MFWAWPVLLGSSRLTERLSELRGEAVVVVCWLLNVPASVSQGRICSDKFTCCHTEIEVADQTFYLTQSPYTGVEKGGGGGALREELQHLYVLDITCQVAHLSADPTAEQTQQQNCVSDVSPVDPQTRLWVQNPLFRFHLSCDHSAAQR